VIGRAGVAPAVQLPLGLPAGPMSAPGAPSGAGGPSPPASPSPPEESPPQAAAITANAIAIEIGALRMARAYPMRADAFCTTVAR